MTALDQARADDQAAAARALLASPLISRDRDPDAFTLVATHHTWLAKRFDDWCGWPLRVDFHAGTARLVKRRDVTALDGTRPATRPDNVPFDPARYSLLMTVCAELVSRPHVTIGDLADTVTTVTAADDQLRTFEVTSRAHRSVFVDVLRWLEAGGCLTVTTGDLTQYAGHRTDAVLQADVKRLAGMLAPVTAPSRAEVDDDADTAGWLAALTDEPRYGDEGGRDDTQRARWARHQLLRALLDDPAVDIDQLPAACVDYLHSISGRRKVAEAVTAVGMQLERHTEVLLAVDATKEATDVTFGERATIVAQAAGVLLADLVEADRTATSMTTERAVATISRLLADDARWALTYQHSGGARSLTDEAVDHLEAFALITLDGDRIVARPAAVRYQVAVADRRPTTPDAAADADPALPLPSSTFDPETP